MRADPEAAILLKCRELIKLLNINLNHFPRHEKYGLCQEMRQAVYGVLAGIVTCQKQYQNKTSLTKLDIQHEQLRAFVNLAFELGYFDYANQKRGRSEAERPNLIRQLPIYGAAV